MLGIGGVYSDKLESMEECQLYRIRFVVSPKLLEHVWIRVDQSKVPLETWELGHASNSMRVKNVELDKFMALYF